MTRQLLLSFAILAVSAVASAKSFTVTLFQPSIVGGAELAPGEYKLDLDQSKVVIHQGKASAEATVKVENGTERFSNTAIRYDTSHGKAQLNELWIGGTKTRLVFMDQPTGAAGQPATVR